MKGNDHAFGMGRGGWNPDVWRMAVELNPDHKFKKDHSEHPIYKGLEVETTADTKLIAFKGPGFTEDHNCLYFNLPSLWTGIGNQEEACYTQLTQTYGIYPLGTWDSQICGSASSTYGKLSRAIPTSRVPFFASVMAAVSSR
jgi:hypothetical protein